MDNYELKIIICGKEFDISSVYNHLLDYSVSYFPSVKICYFDKSFYDPKLF